MTVTIYAGDCRNSLRRMAAESVHCILTSPPYFRLRDYGEEGQIGLEDVMDCLGWATGEPCGECYVCHLVEVFREARRVLRGDGTLWLNLGDSYASTGGAQVAQTKWKVDGASNTQNRKDLRRPPAGFKAKDLMGVPWRVIFALQADDWFFRTDIPWQKTNAMPESVTDRPSRSHEFVFLLSKSRRYYYDRHAVMEPVADSGRMTVGAPTARDGFRRNGSKRAARIPGQGMATHRPDRNDTIPTGMRNLRSVWSIPTTPFSGAHFAVFPEALVEPCIKAGTSAGGCCATCGAPYRRIVGEPEVAGGRGSGNVERKVANGEDSRLDTHLGSSVPWSPTSVPTVGWEPSCRHVDAGTIPATVLDPFGGSGTVGVVAERLGRDSELCELSPKYAYMAERRIRDASPLLTYVMIVE